MHILLLALICAPALPMKGSFQSLKEVLLCIHHRCLLLFNLLLARFCLQDTSLITIANERFWLAMLYVFRHCPHSISLLGSLIYNFGSVDALFAIRCIVGMLSHVCQGTTYVHNVYIMSLQLQL